MSNEKNIERKALDEENLENVSGGMVYQQGDKWVASSFDPKIPYKGLLDPFRHYTKTFDTKEEARAYDKEMIRRIRENGNIWKA